MLIKQGYLKTLNLVCEETFLVVSREKLEDFASKPQFKDISSSLEPSNFFHSRIDMIDSEKITVENQEPSHEIDTISSYLYSWTSTSNGSPKLHASQLTEITLNNKIKTSNKI